MRENYRLVVARLHKLQLLRRLRIQQFTDGITLHYGQMPLLEYIGENSGCTQHDAAQALGVSEPAVATSAKRLEKAGVLAREQDADNMRRNRLTLTEKGRTMTVELRKRFDGLDSAVMGGFTDEELTQLCALLDRMIAAISEGEAEGLGLADISGLAEKVMKIEKHKRSAVDE